VRSVFVKSSLVALGSTAASLSIVALLGPMLGSALDGTAWLMSIICPLAISWPASAFTFRQSERLQRAHDELSAAHAELAAAHRDLAERARRDHMTGLLNRESFFAALDGLRRKSDAGALLIIDADHFKKINDGHGHLVGDAALLEISAAICRGLRSRDLVARIGGEEFAAYLEGASPAEAAVVAERVRREVELVNFATSAGVSVSLTVSIGGTVCAPEATLSDLLRAADHRLYAAKRAGRNRVMIEHGLSQAA
jgi:diguanylate cyclase (GGDEF)-like protein